MTPTRMEPMNTSTVYNPIPRRRTPSAAFKESMMRAKELSAQEGWNEDTDHYNIERNSLRHIGWRTFLFGILMFVGGVIMTVLGACTYWGSTETTKHNGLDLFVVGLIMLLPGAYAVVHIVGAWCKWRGYGALHIPSMDY